jgi:hypothetical protein
MQRPGVPLAALAWLLAAAGCDRPAADVTLADLRAPAAAPAPPAAPISTAQRRPRGSVQVIDTPPWPSGVQASIELTWEVGAARAPGPNEEVGARTVALVARLGKVTRRVALGDASGELFAHNEGACHAALPPADRAYEKAKGEVAKLTLFHAGASGFGARVAKNSVEITRFWEDDGACPDAHGDLGACPPEVELAATMPVPDGARFTESIVEIDASGRATPFDCKR